MKSSPIVFDAGSVLAILSGRKTQFRRPVRGDECPFAVGQRLWVREEWRTEELETFGQDGVRYRADNKFIQIANTQRASYAWMKERYKAGVAMTWRSPSSMPRWASRIELEVTATCREHDTWVITYAVSETRTS